MTISILTLQRAFGTLKSWKCIGPNHLIRYNYSAELIKTMETIAYEFSVLVATTRMEDYIVYCDVKLHYITTTIIVIECSMTSIRITLVLN